MSPRLRYLLGASAVCALAVWIGFSIAEEHLFLASVSALLSLWAILAWTTRPRAEAWLLGFLVAGYVLGNRGFAQITPLPGLPLFFSELGLTVALALVILRGAQQREVPVRRDGLNVLLLLWLGLGGGRMLWDFRVHGLNAVRDFATVYYLLYFFAAQQLAAHPASHRVMHGALTAALAVLPFTAALAQAFPEFFLAHLTMNGVPLIFYKDDLLATFLFGGFICFVPKRRFDVVQDWGRWLLALASLMMGLAQLSRAAMVGLAVALAGLALARIWQPVRTVMAVAFAALLVTALYSLVERKDFTQTKLYGVYEHLVAIVDVGGTGSYANLASLDSGDNNRFRLVWWRAVTVETWQQSPVFGLGFGHDLARGFVQDYYPDSGEEFSTRSPHSIVFTAFGRMGLVGLAGLLLIIGSLARLSLQAARRTAQGLIGEEAVTLHAVSWVILTSALFGVVLEGPMGAIPFWIILGLAHYTAETAAAAETT